MKKLVWIVIISIILIAPFTYPILFSYNPPLEAVEAYETHHITDTTYFGNITKNLQSLKEEEPCIYTILGWDDDENLYYESICEGIMQTYRYQSKSQESVLITKVDEPLLKDVYPDDQLLDMVRATGVRPREHEPYTRPLYLLEDTVTISPNGSYIAFVTKRTYSVQDIVLITQ